MTDTTHTVENALVTLAGRVTLPPGVDLTGYNDFDSSMGHMLAERVVMGLTLTGKQRRAAHRMLRKYEDQLGRAGVDMARLPYPEGDGHALVDVGHRIERPSLTVEQGRIVVRSPFSLKDVCRGVNGGRWNPRSAPRGAWTYPESPRSAQNLLHAFERYDPVTDEGFQGLIREAVRMDAARVHKDDDALPPIPGESMTSWMHQRQAFHFGRELDAALMWMEMGTGKSKVTVDLLRENAAQTTLILCPAKVLGVWPKQFRLHGGLVGGQPRSDLVHVHNGFVPVGRGRDQRMEADTVEGRVRAFDSLIHDCGCGRPHVVVANYEISAYEPFKSWALEQTWDYAVADESHRLRAPQGVWSKWASKLRDRSARRLCLTGTALGQGELDIFAQYRFLDPSIFGTSYTSFASRYAVHGGYQGHEVVAMRTKPTRPGRNGEPVENEYYSPPLAREFDEKLFSICYEVGAEVLDLPPIHIVQRSFALTPAARRAYRQLDEDLFTDLVAIDEAGGEVSTPNVLVKMLRLQQLTGGWLTDDEGRSVAVHTGKADLLEDVLTDVGPEEQVVVFCRFTADLDEVERVAGKLKRRYAELSGRRDDGLTEDSTLVEGVQVCGVQIQAGGVGVDFTASAHAVDYSLGFSLIDYQQHIRRVHRPGQERPSTFIQLVAEGTIDLDVLRSLALNENAVEYVAKRRLRDEVGQEDESDVPAVPAVVEPANAPSWGGQRHGARS